MARNGAGWTIVDLWAKSPARAGRGMRWLARAWDPRLRKHRNQSFPDVMPDRSSGHIAAERWARDKSAKLRLGQDSAGVVSLPAVASSYLDQLKDEGRCKEHRAEIKRVVDSLEAAGITDLLAKDFPLKVRSHIVAWRDQHKFRRTLVDEKGKTILLKRGPNKGKPKREGQLLAASTRHRYLGHVKSIAGFAVTWDYLMKNPMDKVTLDKGVTSQASFNVDELRLLVPHGDEVLWLAFLGMAYQGLRLAEAMHLRWEWIDWSANRLYVKRHPAYRLKRNKERSVPLQPEYRAVLEKRRRDIGWIIEQDELRTITGAAKPNRKKAWRMFHQYVDGRGVTCGERSPHSTRHTWIPLMMATGEDSAFVQLWAGHTEIETTIGYSEARDAMRAAVTGWPRGELRLMPTAIARANAG